MYFEPRSFLASKFQVYVLSTDQNVYLKQVIHLKCCVHKCINKLLCKKFWLEVKMQKEKEDGFISISALKNDFI